MGAIRPSIWVGGFDSVVFPFGYFIPAADLTSSKQLRFSSNTLEIGFIAVPLRWFERILLSAGGLALIVPGIITDMMGFAIFAFILIRNLSLKKRCASWQAKPGG